MATSDIPLHGRPLTDSLVDGYESPEEYADQGDTRVVRDLSFSYMVEQSDTAGGKFLHPVDVPRDTELHVLDMGLLALEKGERHHSFYTTAELEARERGDVAVEGGPTNPSEMGEFELAEWIKNGEGGRERTINEILEAVGDDKDLAHRMLQAENIASDGDPRSGLEQGLNRIITEA